METWLVDLSVLQLVVLLLASFAGSMMTAMLGVGGGAFLLTVMAFIVPPLALIPVHGVAQLGSNGSRAWLARGHTQWPLVGWFALGAVLASVLVMLMLVRLEPGVIPLLIGIFILWLSWGRMPAIGLGEKPAGLFSGGLITTVLTMLVGATGPLVAAWLGHGKGDKWQYTANFSMCMSLQHLLKVLVFGVAGFAFSDWLLVMLLMLIAGHLGTRAGLRFMGRLPEARFRQWFRWVLTLLALQLIGQWWLA